MNKLLAGAFATIGLAAVAAPVHAVTIGDLLPGGGQTSTLPDINTSVLGGLGLVFTYVTDGFGNGTLTVVDSDPLLPFTYIDPANDTFEITSPNQSLNISATFAVNGDTSAAFGGAATGTLEIRGTPEAGIGGLTGIAGDPILTGTLMAVAPSATGIEIVWQVTGGRAASNFGTHAFSLLSPASGIFPYIPTGLTAGLQNFDFSSDGLLMDTTPGQVVPLPPAGLALLAGIAGLAALRRRRAA